MSNAYDPIPPSTPVAPPRVRHPLGLPKGSVRAIFALGVMGLIALIIGTNNEQVPEVQPLYFYLWGVLFLIIANYFAHRSQPGGDPAQEVHPLGLPRGVVRLVLIIGLAAIVFWLWHHDRLFDEREREVNVGWLFLIPAGFVLGWLVSRMVRFFAGGTEPDWYQDIQAWVAIVAMLLLAIVGVTLIWINPNVSPELRRNMPVLEGALVAMVSFYFGARS
jgi:hypothetical protein